MRVSTSDAPSVDELIASHAQWMSQTHSLEPVDGKLHTLEFFVPKAPELSDMMDQSKGTTGYAVYNVTEVQIDDKHFGKHAELSQEWEHIDEFLACSKSTHLLSRWRVVSLLNYNIFICLALDLKKLTFIVRIFQSKRCTTRPFEVFISGFPQGKSSCFDYFG